MEFYERELASFLPDRVFDAHPHLWRRQDTGWDLPGCPDDVGLAEYRDLMDDLHPGRRMGAMFIPSVNPSGDGSFTDQNEWVAQAVADDASFRGIFFIRPTDDPEWVRQEVRRLGLHGLKCYHTMASP